MRISRHLALVSIALTLAAGALTVGPSHVMAATCSGSGCNGRSPHITGCDASGYVSTKASANIMNGGTVVGLVELRYSSLCGTIWARTTNKSGGSSWVASGILRSDGNSYDYSLNDTCTMGIYGDTFCRDNLGNLASQYGYQIYDVGYTSYAVGYICYSDSSCTNMSLVKYNHTSSW